MTSSEDLNSRLINPVTSNTLSVIKYSEPRNEAQSLRRITIVSDSASLNSPISPLRKSDQSVNEYDHRQKPTPRGVSFRRVSMSVIKRQFGTRKTLQNRLGFLSNIMCFLGLLGIILMVAENEITFRSIDNRDTNISWLIKLIITISTVILVGLVIYFHYLNLKLHATHNSLDDWHIALTVKRIVLIILEILICAIHPMPLYFPRHWLSKHEEIIINSTRSNSFVTSSVSPSYIAIDVALGLPMFARLYLICRCIMFHSHFIRDAPSRSLGSFNQISINFPFLMKTYLEQRPARFLITTCCIMFFIGSWSIRACDYKPTVAEHISMLNSMWLFIVTFTTVGYGDLTPSTYCGRTVASIIALFGLLSSALLISVFAQKLQLNRSEKYVNNFVSDVKLTRERREQAANVIKFSIKVWYLKRKGRLGSFQYLKSQRLLFKSIHDFQKIKYEQRKLNDNSLDLVELINIQRFTSIKTKRISREITTIKFTIDKIEEKFADMNNTMNQIQSTLNLLLDKNVK